MISGLSIHGCNFKFFLHKEICTQYTPNWRRSDTYDTVMSGPLHMDWDKLQGLKVDGTKHWCLVSIYCLASCFMIRFWHVEFTHHFELEKSVDYLIIWITGSACFVVVIVGTQFSCETGGRSSWCKLSYIVARCTGMSFTLREVIFRTFKTRTHSTLAVSSSTAGFAWGGEVNTYRN